MLQLQTGLDKTSPGQNMQKQYNNSKLMDKSTNYKRVTTQYTKRA